MENNFMTLKEAANLLRIDYQTIRFLVLSGRIAGFKVGHQWRISKENLDNYLNRRYAKESENG